MSKKYFLYARKSSESEDRQVQSIDDQVKRLKQLANDLDISVKKIYTEAKTAKKPGNRPEFTEMLERIQNGEADGILCWQINRLSRNPVDSGTLGWLLQQGVLKSIQTIDRQYLPEDNVLLFSVETGMANQFLLDLSKNVKRGIKSKLEKGWHPGVAPVGYLNDYVSHTIKKDPERFDLIRRAFDMMLTGRYTAPQVLDRLNNEWGFRSVKRKRSGNKPLAMSGMYKVFTSMFYAGILVSKGEQYPGSHEPIITLEEYDRVQEILGRKGKPRPKRHKFAFTGIIRCGECGCMITAETKTKNVKTTGETKKYTYYHCTKKKKELKCSQCSIKQEELEKQIIAEIGRFTILPEFRDWALEVLNENNDKEITERSKVYEMQHKTLASTQKQLDNLTQMRYRDLIDDDEFTRERTKLQTEINKLKNKLRQTESRADEWLELTEKTFHFATYARKAFIEGDLDTKKEILMTTGSNFTLKDGILHIQANEWLQPIKDHYPPLEDEYKRLELDKNPLNKAKTEALTSVIARWQGLRGSNPRLWFWRPAYYHCTKPPYKENQSYLVSLCMVCFLHFLQNFLISSRSFNFFLFFVE